MHFDFWNNPLVVSAMRIKYRRGSPGIIAAVWVLALLGLGAVLHYAAEKNGFRFPSAYLLAIIGIQFIATGTIATASVSGSMNAEVVNRTLDFQRIVTLSPRSILLGKMLGEPALCYFLAIASIPLAALCWGLGAASGPVIFWLYVNLATFTLMCAAAGLIHSLTPPAQGASRQRSGAGGIAFVVLFFALPQLMFQGTGILEAAGIGDAVQLFTPIGSLIHVWQDNAWNARVTLWNLSVPSLVAAPVVQAVVAAWIVAAMSRRLKNPLDPAVTKLRSYLTLAVVDMVIAGVCYANWKQGFDATRLLYGYCLAHLIVCLLLNFAMVPRRAAVVSWIWRRGQHGAVNREMLLGDRSPIILAGFIMGLIGLAVLTAALVLPIALTAPAGDPGISPARLAEVSAATLVVVAATTMLHQAVVAAAYRGGNFLYIFCVLMANVLPPVAAAALELPAISAPETVMAPIRSLSPAAFFGTNMSRVSDIYDSARWLILLYASLGIGSYLLLRFVLNRQRYIVGLKLKSMGLT